MCIIDRSPDQVEAIVSAFAEATGCDKSQLLQKMCIRDSYNTVQGEKRMYFAKYDDCKASPRLKDEIPHAVPMTIRTRSTFESRLLAKKCEFCGQDDSESYEIHHVHRLKDVKGKTMLEQVMLARKRKTIVLCVECHRALHQGK